MKKPGPANHTESGQFGANTGFEPATFALARRTDRVTDGSRASPAITNPAKSFRQRSTGGGGGYQRSPAINNVLVPPVFQGEARPLDIAQAAILLGWTKDAVRAACERGELAHSRDHLNAYRLPCSAVAAAARSQLKERERRPDGMDPDK
jgi:hypothetical protein